MPQLDGAPVRRPPLHVRILTIVAMVAWISITPGLSLHMGFYESRLQVLHAPDESYSVRCLAAWLGPFQQSVGFAAYPVGDADGASTAVVVDVDTRLAYEGYHLHRRGPLIGDFSEQLVADGVRAAFPHMTPGEIELVAADVFQVMSDSITHGVGGMTFWDEEQGGALAEERLRTLNAYRGPGTAVSFVFRRILITFAAMAGIGVTLWAWLRFLSRRSAQRASGAPAETGGLV